MIGGVACLFCTAMTCQLPLVSVAVSAVVIVALESSTCLHVLYTDMHYRSLAHGTRLYAVYATAMGAVAAMHHLSHLCFLPLRVSSVMHYNAKTAQRTVLDNGPVSKSLSCVRQC
jgi:hypothetical protein